MVYQLFENYAGVEKFENVNEEIEYFQDAEEEIIEYQTEVSEKLREILNEVKKLKKQVDSSTDPNAEVLLVDLEGNLTDTIKQIEQKELSEGDSKVKQNFLVKLFSEVKSMFSSKKEGFHNKYDNDEEGNDEEGSDEEGSDEEGSDAEDAFVETDDNNEIVENFQNNNNTIEYHTGSKKYFSLDLLLRSVLYACLFYVLSHRDTYKLVGKLLKRIPKGNLIYVHMAVFAVVYYLLNLFI